MRFVTGGGLRIDYLITHQGEARTGLLGGNSLYAAVGASIWAGAVNLWARVGRNYPQAWLDRLPGHGIGIEGLVRTEGDQDHRTFFAYTADGQRDDTNPAAHFARINRPLPEALGDYIHSTPGQDEPDRYEPLALRPEDWPDQWGGEGAVHLSPLALRTHCEVPGMLRRRGVRCLTVDPGERYMIPERESQIRGLLPQVDAFLPSNMEVRSLFGDDVDLWAAAERLHQWGAPVVVVKNGADGVLLLDGPGRRRLQVGAYHGYHDSRVVDVTGAGDSFCGGFMVGMAQSGDPLLAARMGIVSASFVVEGYGALYALDHCQDKGVRLAEISSRPLSSAADSQAGPTKE